MWTLAVDSCTERAAVALGREGQLLWELHVRLGRRHAETLQGLVEQGLKALNIRLQDIDLFCCTQGPGSYTGLRIGLTMVKTWAYALHKPVLGLSGLAVLARQEGLGSDEAVLSLIDAGKGRCYMGLYTAEDSGCLPREHLTCWSEASDVPGHLARAVRGLGLRRLHLAGNVADAFWGQEDFARALESMGLARGLLLRRDVAAGAVLSLAWADLAAMGLDELETLQAATVGGPGTETWPSRLRPEALCPLYLNPTQAEKRAEIYV